jgi:predicted amidohydrolase
MSLVRVAVASTPLTATLEAAVPAAIEAIEEAGRAGAQVVCLPESTLPGHRVQARSVPDVSADQLARAVDHVAGAVRHVGLTAIVGLEQLTTTGRQIASVVIGPDGAVLGIQAKTQIDPTEEAAYVPGDGRRVFESDGLTFGIAICHEAFRYPEITRTLVLAGARVVFVPHFVTTDDGALPTRWRDPANPYNEQAIRLRALENSVYVAAANVAGPTQGSITGIIDPAGELVASLPYGVVGVVAADLDLATATAELARRWSPERNAILPGAPSAH